MIGPPSQGRRNLSISVEARPKGEHTRSPLHQSLHGGQVICDNQSVERQRTSVVREAALAAGEESHLWRAGFLWSEIGATRAARYWPQTEQD